MQRRDELVRELQDSFIAGSGLSHADAMRLYEDLWAEARRLGVVPGDDPWAGLEADLRIARILATCSPNS